jgi:hypothetical protein
MQLIVVTWKIIGVRPLMQSNYREIMPVDTETKTGGRRTTKSRLKPFVEASKQLYNGDEGYWHPALAFWRSMLEHCTGYEVAGKAASSLIPKLVFPPEDEKFLLYDPDTLGGPEPRKLTDDDWQMDSRRVVNEKKGALIVHRPKWPRWGGFLVMEVDVEAFPGKEDSLIDVITAILNVVGRYGTGAGRMRKDQKTKQWGGLGLGKFTAERVK